MNGDDSSEIIINEIIRRCLYIIYDQIIQIILLKR